MGCRAKVLRQTCAMWFHKMLTPLSSHQSVLTVGGWKEEQWLLEAWHVGVQYHLAKFTFKLYAPGFRTKDDSNVCVSSVGGDSDSEGASNWVDNLIWNALSISFGKSGYLRKKFLSVLFLVCLVCLMVTDHLQFLTHKENVGPSG